MLNQRKNTQRMEAMQISVEPNPIRRVTESQRTATNDETTYKSAMKKNMETESE